jgi:hypothetical protein
MASQMGLADPQIGGELWSGYNMLLPVLSIPPQTVSPAAALLVTSSLHDAGQRWILVRGRTGIDLLGGNGGQLAHKC